MIIIILNDTYQLKEKISLLQTLEKAIWYLSMPLRFEQNL